VVENDTTANLHLQAKYHVEQYGRKKGFESFTPILCASFMECFFYDPFVDAFGGFPWIPDAETGETIFRTPPYGGKGDMPWVSCEDDLGDIVHGIFLDPTKYDQTLVQATGQQITMPDIAASYAEGTDNLNIFFLFLPSSNDTESVNLQRRASLRDMKKCLPGRASNLMVQGAGLKLVKCSGT